MSNRELIVRRDDAGKFSESVDVGKSLAADQCKHSQNEAPRGEGDKGDRRKKH